MVVAIRACAVLAFLWASYAAWASVSAWGAWMPFAWCAALSCVASLAGVWLWQLRASGRWLLTVFYAALFGPQVGWIGWALRFAPELLVLGGVATVVPMAILWNRRANAVFSGPSRGR